jgi:hypothetical protein
MTDNRDSDRPPHRERRTRHALNQMNHASGGIFRGEIPYTGRAGRELNPMLNPTQWNDQLNRRSLLLGATAWTVGVALTPGPIAHAAGLPQHVLLGVNTNQNLTWLEPALMAQTRTTWVRGFVPASQFISGARAYANDPGLAVLRAAAAGGHKIVLTIKWDCTGKAGLGPVPPPGSSGEQDWFDFADALVRSMTGSLSILVVVNELLIDTRKPDLAPGSDGTIPMVLFLRRLVAHLSASRPLSVDGGPLPLYAGGFTRLDLPTTQNAPAVGNSIAWINRDPKVAGADFHLHQPDLATSGQALAYARAQIPTKPLIVTEFSLIWKWQRHFEDAIGASASGAAFASQHGLSPQMTVREFCNQAFARPVPQAEWQAFLASQSWFEPGYLEVIGPMMEQYGLSVATYGFTNDPLPGAPAPTKQLASGGTPWFINNLLVPGLAYVPSGKRAPENYGFFTSFVKWQISSANLGLMPVLP